jgi:hypothetical protein
MIRGINGRVLEPSKNSRTLNNRKRILRNLTTSKNYLRKFKETGLHLRTILNRKKILGIRTLSRVIFSGLTFQSMKVSKK